MLLAASIPDPPVQASTPAPHTWGAIKPQKPHKKQEKGRKRHLPYPKSIRVVCVCLELLQQQHAHGTAQGRTFVRTHLSGENCSRGKSPWETPDSLS